MSSHTLRHSFSFNTRTSIPGTTAPVLGEHLTFNLGETTASNAPLSQTSIGHAAVLVTDSMASNALDKDTYKSNERTVTKQPTV